MSSGPALSFRYEETLLTAVLFFGAMGLFSLDWFNGLPGGVSTVGAERVLNGEVPYRDFWTMYAPGHFYLLALLFRIFGTHLLVEVVAASVISAGAACLCYRLALNLAGRRLAALACSIIFLAAMYNTGYFRSLGTYPPAIFFVFAALNFFLLHGKSATSFYLVAVGLATGVAITFKHDIGGYTAIATVAGLVAHQLSMRHPMRVRLNSLVLNVLFYSAGVVVVVLPVVIYFANLAGFDMLQNLVIFPLTDFRFARPEAYSSLLPFGIYDTSTLKLVGNLCKYLIFTVPFMLFFLGILAIRLAVNENNARLLVACVTFLTAFLLHYVAAHVQINTHIISLSAYASYFGIIFYSLLEKRLATRRLALGKSLMSGLMVVWLLGLIARPVYHTVVQGNHSTGALSLAKVSGFRVPAEERDVITNLAQYVSGHVPRDHKLFVGLNRHDVVIAGDIMSYFILNRRSGTRYRELHPAVADTQAVQREIIRDLQNKKIDMIILRYIFASQHLEEVKRHFLKNLPHIGATDLDQFIRTNYERVRNFGSYGVWIRKTTIS